MPFKVSCSPLCLLQIAEPALTLSTSFSRPKCTRAKVAVCLYTPIYCQSHLGISICIWYLRKAKFSTDQTHLCLFFFLFQINFWFLLKPRPRLDKPYTFLRLNSPGSFQLTAWNFLFVFTTIYLHHGVELNEPHRGIRGILSVLTNLCIN